MDPVQQISIPTPLHHFHLTFWPLLIACELCAIVAGPKIKPDKGVPQAVFAVETFVETPYASPKKQAAAHLGIFLCGAFATFCLREWKKEASKTL